MKGILLVLLEYVQKSARTLLRGNLLQAACPPNLLPILPNADSDDDDDDANNLSKFRILFPKSIFISLVILCLGARANPHPLVHHEG
jgi:hypothetical protein